MKVWTNRNLDGEVLTWKCNEGRTLLLYNNTGRIGKCFDRVYLTYKRNGRRHTLSMAPIKHRRKQEKTVGIWMSHADYELITMGEIWTGKAKKGHIVAGRYGIYNVGTKLVCEGYTWLLKEDKGWVIIDRPANPNEIRRII